MEFGHICEFSHCFLLVCFTILVQTTPKCRELLVVTMKVPLSFQHNLTSPKTLLTKLSLFPPVVLERRYPKEVQDLYETMRRFARILGPVEHDKFIESHACGYFEDFSIYILQRV